MTQPKDLLFMCRQCKHYCQVQADVNAVGCQLKHCGYEPSYDAKRFYELEEELSFILKKAHELPKGYHLFVVESEET